MKFDFLFLVLVIVNLSGCIPYKKLPLDTTHNKDNIISLIALNKNFKIPFHSTKIQIDMKATRSASDIGLLAVLMSPDLAAFRAKENVAKAQVFDAGLLPDPQFSFGIISPITYLKNTKDALNYSLNYDVAALITTKNKLRVVKPLAKQVHYDIAWQEWITANQAESFATQCFYLNQQISLTSKATQAAKKTMNVSYKNLKKNLVTIDEFGLRQTTYLDFLDQLINLKRTLKKTRLQLNQLLGMSFNKRFSIILDNRVILPHNLELKFLFEQAKHYRLDLLALRYGYESQEAALYQAILGQFPHVSLNLNQGSDNMSFQTGGAGITFDIPIINRNRGIIAVNHATRKQLRLEYAARLNQTYADIAILLRDISLIQHEISILEQKLPTLRKVEKLMNVGMLSGNVTLINYQSILTSLLTNEIRLLVLKQSLNTQAIALRIATGKYWY